MAVGDCGLDENSAGVTVVMSADDDNSLRNSVNNRCCGMRSQIKILAWTQIVLAAVVGVLAYVVVCIIVGSFSHRTGAIDEIFRAANFFGIVCLCLIDGTSGVLLLIGTTKEATYYIRVWIIVTIPMMVLMVLGGACLSAMIGWWLMNILALLLLKRGYMMCKVCNLLQQLDFQKRRQSAKIITDVV